MFHLFKKKSEMLKFARSGVRSFTQQAEQTSSRRTNIAVASSTLLSVGMVALYYNVYGPKLSAASPKEEGLHFIKHEWPQEKLLKGFDHASLRRGFQVYREVCSACHALDYIAWRHLVGVTHTADEVKEMASEYEYEDGPDDEGKMFKRPGKLSDFLPAPYPNVESARGANNGAAPPDLSLVVRGRHGGPDYVYSLLTGYVDPPAGVEIPDGMNFNPFFPGTQIAMARPLFDEAVEFEDGTTATTSQASKDVVNFLHWANEPDLDTRKKMGFQVMTVLTIMTAISMWYKRFKWSPIKNRKIVYQRPVSK
ncbi:cytochrome c1 Cyt1 [Schizosaccharomyces osmophilus]|uniref:quinol--cytochrome-c reductase n=1 Tax=Schizosaccharomyces osmophilus TaxID=2545709 RepID=A0AAF0ATR1_9SCHI|nr:cytochrome c1 Cyt1 [Schizosaccharomyces osmophilus]WBW71731.1 cytochrome c1 Cyt1 [Schizosaccharomyces osmophilus]